ncbi:MAG: alkaline phosphatase D [Myxococcota bacterium]|jgi:alkaline phosphatase D
MLPKLTLLVISLATAVGLQHSEAPFAPQLSGNTLEDWLQVGGQASYTVTDGTVHGVGATGGNAFLHSPREYADFELTCQLNMTAGGNSGIQIRSAMDGTRLRGYQIEIDGKARAYTGGLYDEGGRGWLQPLEGDAYAAARAAMTLGEWTDMRILAVGNHIQTWVNGVPVCDYRDDALSSGIIAFQVHGGGVTDIKWRDIKIREIASTNRASNSAPRTWVSGNTWANRLQDWQRTGERIECVESSKKYPLRTLMSLDQSLNNKVGKHRFSVMIDGTHKAGIYSGFGGILFGAGGDDVDYRLSAQVHHRPATDGGLLATLNLNGDIALYDNSQSNANTGQWSIGGALGKDALQQICLGQNPFRSGLNEALRLQVDIDVNDVDATVTLTAYQGSSDTVVSTCTAAHIAHHQIDGLFGLVSHLGSADGGYAFSDFSNSGDLANTYNDHAFGPVVGVQYTQTGNRVRLNAQLVPLENYHNLTAVLMIERAGQWQVASTTTLKEGSWNMLFSFSRDLGLKQKYKVILHADEFSDYQYSGTFAAEPDIAQTFALASMNCLKHYVGDLQWNQNSIWFPHQEIVDNVKLQNVDMLYFAGDQLYEGDLDPVDNRNLEKLTFDYLYKWYRFYWSLGELTRHLPSVSIPDDHDVYQGNLWGAGGRRAQPDKSRGLTAQDAGGYTHDIAFVNVVHETQTGHLPRGIDQGKCESGMSVYFTDFKYANVDFIVLADRQFKDSASDVVPDGAFVNGWAQAINFDNRDADVPGASLLGARQEKFLSAWSKRKDARYQKVVLSQTPFCNLATLPEKAKSGSVLPGLPIPELNEYPQGYKFAADTDSGGWPQSARNRAVNMIGAADAIHLAGDQHLGSLLRYTDSGAYVFTSPAMANTWPRRWWPPLWGKNPEPDAPHYTGDFKDGFGNPITVIAVANPLNTGLEPASLYDRMPGYGVIRFADEVVFECWPRWVNPTAADAAQFAGWPFTLKK